MVNLTYIKYGVEYNDKDLKCKFGGPIITSKYKNVFAKGYSLNWSEDVFLIKKVKNTVWWIYFISDLKVEEIVWNILLKRVTED